jgi:predicted nucleic-acid-binding protein
MLGNANAMVAALVSGREDQRRATTDMVRERGRLEIGEGVLCEACWVLERTYRIPRSVVAEMARTVLGSPQFVAWDPALAESALSRMESEPRFALVDCLLLERAVAGESVFTFDRNLARAIERA